MNYREQGVDLTKLGSGKHEPITSLPHAEMPFVSPDDLSMSRLTIGQKVEDLVIMQYFQERPDDAKPIINTLSINEKGKTHSQELLDSNP